MSMVFKVIKVRWHKLRKSYQHDGVYQHPSYVRIILSLLVFWQVLQINW